MVQERANNKMVKKSFWVALAFYLLIAFEFFYMVSPFAAYFYSVYKPGLAFLNNYSNLGWLSSTFLPHFVAHTSSPLLKLIGQIGVVLTIGGLLMFIIGAGQVYYNKLTRKKAVTGGVYIFIRHPQYAALAISGLGLLLLWPRYLVLLSYITMLFFYYFLARVEEVECERKFGDSYREYLKKTNMFFPIRFGLFDRIRILPRQGIARYLMILVFYIGSCFVGIGAADLVKNWSLEKIYAVYEKDSATISVTRLSKKSISELLSLARKEAQYKTIHEAIEEGPQKAINYIMPTDWSASEIPMNPVPRRENGGVDSPHGYPEDKIVDRYRIVFTRAIQRNQQSSEGKEILHNTIARIPLLEMIIDLPKGKVISISDPVKDYRLEEVPLPLY